MNTFLKLCGLIILITLSSAIKYTEQNTNIVELQVGDDFQNIVDIHDQGITFLIKAGTHRMQSVVPKEGQKFIGEDGAIMSGAMLLESGNWVEITNNGKTLWKYENVPVAPNPEPFKGQEKEGCQNGIPCNRPEDLFLNDNFLKQTSTLAELDESGEWFLEYGPSYDATYAKHGITNGTVYMFDNPTIATNVVEISLTRFAFGVHSQAPGIAGPWNKKAVPNVTIENLVIEKYASLIAYGAIGNRVPGDNWTIKSNEVKYNHGAGIHFASNTLVEKNNVHHNGQIGIKSSNRAIVGVDTILVVVDSKVLENEIWANGSPNVGYKWGAEGGGTKFVRTVNLLVKGNHVYNNNGPGLWTDIENYGTIYELNVVENNLASGIFHEISGKATIRNNIVKDNAVEHGAQIYIAESNDVKVYGNEVYAGLNPFSNQYHDPDAIILRRGCRQRDSLINNYIHHNKIVIAEGSTYGKTGIQVGNPNVQQGGADCFDTAGVYLFTIGIEGLETNKFDFNTYEISCSPESYWTWFNSIPEISPLLLDFQEFQNNGQELNGALNTTQISVVAKGTSVNGTFAKFRLYVNGMVVGEASSTAEYEEYGFCTSIPESEIKEVWVEFFNDAYSPPEDRNLLVESIKVGSKEYLTSEKTILDKGEKDGIGIVPGQVVLPWNAFLIFHTFPQQYLTVRAKGTAIENVYAHFEVMVNGEYIGEASTMGEFFDYQFPISFTCTEIESVEVVFDNDLYVNPEDRNLWIESLGICGDMVHHTANNVSYIRSDGENIPYRTVMYWGGKMVFDFQNQPIVKAGFRSINRVIYTGMPVSFTDHSEGNVNAWEWSFGDGQTSTAQHPVISYSEPGVYPVFLFINNGADVACEAAYIQVLPNKPAPYELTNGGDFETNPYDFGPLPYDAYTDSVPFSSISYFKLGNSSIPGKNGTVSGNNAWVIGKDKANIELAKTVLYSPNFDLSASHTYALEFKAKYSTVADVIGFVVEYSLDKGESWSLVGNFLGDGWYNSYSDLNTTLPEAVYSQFPNMPFFSGSTDGEFKSYIVNISELQGEPNVAFRFRFESNPSSGVSGSIGLALDDFRLITNSTTINDYAFAYIRGTMVNDVFAHFNTYVNEVFKESHFSHEPFLYYRIPYVNFPSNLDSIWIQFDNDFLANGQDRNLYIDHLIFKGITYPYNSPSVKIDPGLHDGVGVIPGQQVLPWNAAMIFDFNINPADTRISGPLSVNDFLIDEPFNIYPNPGNGRVYVIIGEVKERGSILVRDLSGRIIYSEMLNSKQSYLEKSIDINQNKPGLYILEFTTDGMTEMRKYIKF